MRLASTEALMKDQLTKTADDIQKSAGENITFAEASVIPSSPNPPLIIVFALLGGLASASDLPFGLSAARSSGARKKRSRLPLSTEAPGAPRRTFAFATGGAGAFRRRVAVAHDPSFSPATRRGAFHAQRLLSDRARCAVDGLRAPRQDRRLYRRAAALHRRDRICPWRHRLSLLALCHCQSCRAAEPHARASDWLGDHSHAALSPRRWVRRAARRHARPLWRVCLYRHGAAAREARAATASDQISPRPGARAHPACALHRDHDQCRRSRRGRSHSVVAGPCQDRHHRGSSVRGRAVGHSRLQTPKPPVVRSC